MPNQLSSSPKPESLDEIVSHSAVTLAEQIHAAAAWAKSEMDLQVEVAAALKSFGQRARITLEGHHNVTIATGRPDSVYGSVIVEYKAPGTLSPLKESSANKALIDQLKKRFYDMRREEHRAWNSMFGVGTDGNYLIFLRFRDDKWTDQEPLEVNRYSAVRFLWALYNLGQKGKPYQPEYLHGDFGAESEIARDGVRTLYEEILATDSPKAQVFFNQWKILFGEVCGYDVENLSDKLKKLAEFYVGKGTPQPAQLLFAVHTYYAILIKLLAAEIVSFFNPWMTRQVEKLQSATTPTKLRRELEELERGGVFHALGITNFLEGDLFSWYLAAWNSPIENLVRRMITKLDEYNPGTFSEDPAQSRDLLKKLYQQLFPKSVRHDLGEYYTPDWLAEHVLNELGYEGDPDKRLLDPACGSGTFLVMAINRIRRWYDATREKCAYDEGDLLKKILANVVGFDLNPLAVMAARTNYLVAIKDLIRRVDSVEIPVYLCDSIMTPAEYGDLFTGQGKVAKVPCSAMKPPHLFVPKEIASSPKEVAKYAEVLENCVKNGYAPGEFLIRCKDEGLTITATPAHVSLYEELVKLDKANKNGIWARIIKNNFAPLFVGKVDYVAGNPPWVRWGYLPREYREDSTSLWQNYGLFSLKGFEARLGSGEKDLSQLFVYACIDHYLSGGGRLGFLITQTVFKAKGQAEGFRRFRLGKDGDFFRIVSVSDFSRLQPFEGASNLTVSFVAEKGARTQYPVPYTVWVPTEELKGRLFDRPLEEMERRCERVVQQARPVDSQKENSQWQTSSGSLAPALALLRGPAGYTAKIGARTDPYGVFQVRVIKNITTRLCLVENCAEAGKTTVDRIQRPLESDILYPLVRGRDVDSWRASPNLYVVMVQDPSTRAAIPESTLRAQHPRAYEYLSHFRPVLTRRGSRAVQAVMNASAFYAMFAVGHETFAPFKVAWRRMGNVFRAALLSSIADPFLGAKLVIPSDTVTFVPFDDEEEALFFLGLVNSSPARAAIYSFSAPGRGLGAPAIMKHLKLRRFAEAERDLRTSISRAAGAVIKEYATAQPSLLRLRTYLDTIDRLAARYWGLSPRHLADCAEAAQAAERTSSRVPVSQRTNQELLDQIIEGVSDSGEE